MKIYYEVNKKGVVHIDDDLWVELKEDYENDINRFALVSVSEEIHEFNEEAITITDIER